MKKPQFVTVSISLPTYQRDWILKRVATEGYGNFSEYVRELIRNKQSQLGLNVGENLDNSQVRKIKLKPKLPQPQVSASKGNNTRNSAESQTMARFRECCELYELGIGIMEQNVRREHPSASEVEIRLRLSEWLRTHEGAEYGDGDGVPAPERLQRIIQSA